MGGPNVSRAAGDIHNLKPHLEGDLFTNKIHFRLLVQGKFVSALAGIIGICWLISKSNLFNRISLSIQLGVVYIHSKGYYSMSFTSRLPPPLLKR